MSYVIEWKRSASKALRQLDKPIRRRIIAAVEDLQAEPQPKGSISLVGTPDWRRIRVGDYRIVYEVQDDRLVILVLRVGHRSDVYRNL